jgi:hypothetical protein
MRKQYDGLYALVVAELMLRCGCETNRKCAR